MTATQVTRTLKVTPLSRWFSPPNGDSHPAARPVTSPVMDAYFRSWPSCARQHLLLRCPAATYPLGRILRQPVPVSFSWKETGASDTAAALIALGFAATPLVTTATAHRKDENAISAWTIYLSTTVQTYSAMSMLSSMKCVRKVVRCNITSPPMRREATFGHFN